MAVWTVDTLIAEAQKYETRTAMARQNQAAYRATLRKGLGDVVFAHMPVPKRYTLEELEEIGGRFLTRSDWMEQDPSSFQAAHRMGIIDEIAPLTRRPQ